MNRKEQLYYLLEAFQKGEYTVCSFCDQFVEIYSKDAYDKSMTLKENEYMEQICRLAERYSPYEDDILLDSFFIDKDTFKVLFDDLYKNFYKEIFTT